MPEAPLTGGSTASEPSDFGTKSGYVTPAKRRLGLLAAANAANQARRDGCPNREAHVEAEPTGYLAWHGWAKQMSKTHRQRQCPGCGLWLIWEPR